MKIQPYNKNSKHEEAKQALHNLYEQENEEENRKKKNTGCEIRNIFKEMMRILVAWKERIDLEEEKARKEMERVEKQKAELEEEKLRILDKIVQIEEDEDRGYNQRGGRGDFRPRGRGGYRGGRNQ